jgi:histidinol phosphatase-like enzyme (inositol monophosphatase family)
MRSDREFPEFAKKLALASGALIRGYFQKDLEIKEKSDRSIVTQADREGESLMRDMIRKEFPDHGIVGEEYGLENENAEFVWVLDPIDGTISFAHGNPLFGTLIALLHGGKPVLGIIHNPVLGELCIGHGGHTELNDKRVRMREVTELSRATLLATGIRGIYKRFGREGFDRLVESTALFRTWGDCYGYLMLAAGRADIMLDSKMAPWDLLALVPIIRGAGGKITTWSGGDPVVGDSCVAASAGLHEKVMETLHL